MPGDTTRTPLTTWRRDIVRATVLAYRAAKGEGATEAESHAAAKAAYLAAGGDPDAAGPVYEIIAAAIRDHGEWFWRPLRRYMDRQERYMRTIGMWPPPMIAQTWPTVPADFE
jgi:hypothetical protein